MVAWAPHSTGEIFQETVIEIVRTRCLWSKCCYWQVNLYFKAIIIHSSVKWIWDEGNTAWTFILEKSGNQSFVWWKIPASSGTRGYPFCLLKLLPSFSRSLLAFVFVPVVQKEMDNFVGAWNSHRVRKQKEAQVPKGIPDHLYAFPENYGAEDCGMYSRVLLYIERKQLQLYMIILIWKHHVLIGNKVAKALFPYDRYSQWHVVACSRMHQAWLRRHGNSFWRTLSTSQSHWERTGPSEALSWTQLFATMAVQSQYNNNVEFKHDFLLHSNIMD